MSTLKALLPLIRSLQVTCLGPYTVNKKLEKSKFMLIYSVIIIVISIVALVIGIFQEDIYLDTIDDTTGNTIDFVQLLGIRLAHIASLLESVYRRNDQIEFIEKLEEVDKIFESKLGVNMKEYSSTKHTIVQMLILFSTYFCVEICIVSILIFNKEYSYIQYWVYYLLPLCVCGLRFFQVFFCCLLLNNRFKILNLSLTEIQSSVKSFDKIKHGKLFTTVAHFNGDLKPDSSTNYDKLVLLRTMYDRLWHLGLLINKSFGFSILANTGNAFLSVTCNLYWMFLVVRALPENFEEGLKTFGNYFLKVITGYIRATDGFPELSMGFCDEPIWQH